MFRREIPGRVPATELVIPMRPYRVIVRIEGAGSMRLRRSLLLIIYRHLKEGVRPILAARIYQKGGHHLNWIAEELRPISLGQAPRTSTAVERLGFRIRMLRLERGWTQAELARRSGVSLNQISEIERGCARARQLTLRRLGRALLDERGSESETGNNQEFAERVPRELRRKVAPDVGP